MINKQNKFTVSQIKGKKSKVTPYKPSDFESSLEKTYNKVVKGNPLAIRHGTTFHFYQDIDNCGECQENQRKHEKEVKNNTKERCLKHNLNHGLKYPSCITKVCKGCNYEKKYKERWQFHTCDKNTAQLEQGFKEITLWHKIQTILAEEINICREEGQPTSRLTAVYNRLSELFKE